MLRWTLPAALALAFALVGLAPSAPADHVQSDGIRYDHTAGNQLSLIHI